VYVIMTDVDDLIAVTLIYDAALGSPVETQPLGGRILLVPPDVFPLPVRGVVYGQPGFSRQAGTGWKWVMQGNVDPVDTFVDSITGKPYGWANAGPDSYDCSGIVSAVYNLLHNRSPYSHTFSTESAGNYFRKPGFGGPLIAGWSHPGQRPASASVGHMMGMVGGLTFESTGSRGVHLGSTTRRVTDFANVGHFAKGGLVRLANIAHADFGSANLAPGNNLIYNGTGQNERLETPSGGPQRLHPDDIEALALAIGTVLGGALTGTLPAARTAARQVGKRPR